MMRALKMGLISLAAALAACSGEQQELQQWLDQEKASSKPSVQPIAAPKKFVPEPYLVAGEIDPFSNQKLSAGAKLDQRQSSSLLESEMRRRKDPLEAYPLDSMTMVGSVVKQGRPHALVKVENLLYYVKQGEYLGQNYGRVTKIGETDLTLREIVQDSAGEWIERTSTLQLQENAR